MVRKGVAVTIVTTNSEVEGKVVLDQWLDTDYGRVIYYTSRSVLFPWRMMSCTLAAIPRCDVMHLTSLYYPSSLVFAFAARWHGKPIVWSPHGELFQYALDYGSWTKAPIRWLIRRFFAKKVVFHSTSPAETQRVKMVMDAQAKVTEIPNFLELPVPVAPNPSTPPYLLFTGRVHPIKALENLITALSQSAQFKALGLQLTIAGDSGNPYAEGLRQQAKDLGLQSRVQFIGSVDGEAKQALYANAYFLILPSHSENFGNVVVESLAQGTPVIASTGTPWALLAEQQAGFWVDNTPAALTTAIEQALQLPPEEYRHYRNRALALARQSFDIHANVEYWLAAYAGVMAAFSPLQPHS